MTCWQKCIELTFDTNGNFYCMKENVYIRKFISTTMLILLPRFPNSQPKVFLFPIATAAAIGLSNIVVLRIWNNNSKLPKNKANFLKKYMWRNFFLSFTCIFKYLPYILSKHFFFAEQLWITAWVTSWIITSWCFSFISHRRKNVAHYQSEVIFKNSNN